MDASPTPGPDVTPSPRTPHQRDRRFARVRRTAASVLVGSGVLSGLMVGYLATTTRPLSATAPRVSPAGQSPSTTTTSPSGTTPAAGSSGAPVASAPATSPAAPTTTTTAPTTTTTTCYSTPSGQVVCL